MENGLHNGLYNGTNGGLFDGLRDGMTNGMYSNDSKKTELLKDGLVLHYYLNNPKCWRGTNGSVGDSIKDLSLSENNGTLQNLAYGGGKLVDVEPNYHLNINIQFAGQQYVSFANNDKLNLGNGGCTMAIWVRPYVNNGDYLGLIGKNYGGGIAGRHGLVTKNNYAVGCVYQHGGGTIDLTSGQNVLKQFRWNLVTLVINRITGIRIYVDDRLVASDTTNTSGTNLAPSIPYYVGRYDVANLIPACEVGAWWHYNKAQTKEQVEMNYRVYKNRFQ